MALAVHQSKNAVIFVYCDGGKLLNCDVTEMLARK